MSVSALAVFVLLSGVQKFDNESHNEIDSRAFTAGMYNSALLCSGGFCIVPETRPEGATGDIALKVAICPLETFVLFPLRITLSSSVI